MTASNPRFGTAFADALAARGWSQRGFASHYGTTQTTINRWCSGDVPDPHTVFDLEQTLDLEPGSLSRHLGFVPDGPGRRKRPDTVAAITADPALDDRARAVMLAVYRALTDG